MKRQYLKKGLFMIFVFGLLVSCSNDEDYFMTPGELSAQKLQSLIAKEHPSSVSMYEFQWDDFFDEYNWESIVSSSDYGLDGAFIRVDDYYFNLEKLQRFRMHNSSLEIYLNIE